MTVKKDIRNKTMIEIEICERSNPLAFASNFDWRLLLLCMQAIELVGIECALGQVTRDYFYKYVALINPPHWIYLYCSMRIIQ